MPAENSLRSLLRPFAIDTLDAVIILGSGLADCFAERELDHLIDAGPSAVPGHTGRFAILRRDGRTLLLALGRKHLYEGYEVREAARVVREGGELGAAELIVTNAAGGLNPDFRTGEIMLIEDYLADLLGARMRGEYAPGIDGVPALRGALPRPMLAVERYDAIERGALERGLSLRRGIYVGVMGPSYETRAEIRALRRMGADAVGMSTIPEIAEAVRRGMRATGLSLITNTLSDTARIMLDHSDVVEQGRIAAERMRLALDAALDVVAS